MRVCGCVYMCEHVCVWVREQEGKSKKERERGRERTDVLGLIVPFTAVIWVLTCLKASSHSVYVEWVD